MSEKIEKQLDELLHDLEMEHEESESRPRPVRMLTDAIGRCYDLLDQSEKAKHYFALAAEACVDSLTDRKGISMSRPDERGNDRLTCARILWRIEDARAKTYFQQALDDYKKGYNSELEGIRYNCWKGSIFCWIFLEEYEDAMTGVKTCYNIEESSEIPYPGSPIGIMATVIKNCEKGDTSSYIESLSILEEFFRIDGTELYWRNSPPEVDVYEFIKRKAR